MVVLTGQLNLHEQINCSPNRVEETRKREVEEAEPEIRRGCRSHESLNRSVAALDFPAISIFTEEATTPVGHEYRVLPVIIMLGVLFASVDQRRLVPLVVSEMELAVCFVSVLTPLEQPFGLGFFAGLHPIRHDVRKPALADHLPDVLTVELPIHQYIIDVNEILDGVEQVLDDFLA